MSVMLNDLYDYVPLKIYQDDNYFKFSLDSVLLAEYVNINNKIKSIIELCSGNCAVSMILSTRTNANITAVEVQEEIFKLGKKSIEHNGLTDRINLVHSDIKKVNKYFPGNKIVDVIVCNPPYFKNCETSYINDEKIKAIARHEILTTLEEIIKISSNILQIDGELYLIHRSERFDEIINFGFKYNICVKNAQFISTKQGKEPTLVLVRCVKGSNPGVKIAPILCIENKDTFKNIFRKE